MTTRLTIVNRALSVHGAIRLTSEEDPGAEPLLDIYDAVTEFLLACCPWSFATPVRQLVKEVATPAWGWKFQFALPSDRLGSPRAVFTSATLRDPFKCWEIREQKLLADVEEIWCSFTKLVPPVEWPGYFRMLAVRACAAEYALTVREDQALHARMRTEVYGSPDKFGEGGMLADMKALDAQGTPSKQLAIDGDPLTDARWSSGSRRWG